MEAGMDESCIVEVTSDGCIACVRRSDVYRATIIFASSRGNEVIARGFPGDRVAEFREMTSNILPAASTRDSILLEGYAAQLLGWLLQIGDEFTSGGRLPVVPIGPSTIVDTLVPARSEDAACVLLHTDQHRRHNVVIAFDRSSAAHAVESIDGLHEQEKRFAKNRVDCSTLPLHGDRPTVRFDGDLAKVLVLNNALWQMREHGRTFGN